MHNPLLWYEVLIENALAKALPDLDQAGNENDARKEGNPAKIVNANQQCEATITLRRLRKSRSTKHWLWELAPVCLGLAGSGIHSLSCWANATPLLLLPKAVNTPFSIPKSNIKQKACVSNPTASSWHKDYYWLNSDPCVNELGDLGDVYSKGDEPEAPLRYRNLSDLMIKVQSDRLKATTPLSLTPITEHSFHPTINTKKQGLSKKEAFQIATLPLEAWTTLIEFSEAIPGKQEKSMAPSRPVALALNEALPVKDDSSGLLATTSSNQKEPQQPLVFQSAALLTGDYQRRENSATNSYETELGIASIAPASKNDHRPQACPPPLIACATNQLAQTPPVSPSPSPPVPPSNLQPNPNQDRFLQPPQTPAPITPESPTVQPSPTPTPSVEPTPNSPAFLVQKINVVGSTIFSANQIQGIVQPFEGRSLTLEQLREVADAITQLYLNQGYITSRAIIVDQAISNGVVEIRVLEGSLEEIRIEGARRVNENYIRSRVRLGAKTPLNTAQLEDQLRLLRSDPLFENVEASLRAGKGTGQSILIVRVVEANPFEGSVGVDNYSPPSVGSERLGLNLLYRNLTGNGDAIAGSFYHTAQGGADSFDLSYRLPVNAMNGALQLRTSLTRNNIVDPTFKFLGIEGDSQLYEVSFQQPLIRSPREEFSLSLGFAYQENKSTSALGSLTPFADSEGVTRTSVIKFGQDYLRRDVRGAWSMRSLFSFGTGLFDATENAPPLPDGQFFSWLGQVQRVQILGNNNFLIAGFDVQLTPNRLLPSQQFVIGGGQSLRGYRQNIRAGDNGVRFSVEDRIALERNEAGNPTFQLAPFFDAGIVWNNDTRNRPLPSEQFLAGIGLGLIWEPIPKLSLRLDYGYPLIDIKDKGTNAQDEGFYFNVRYQF